MKHTLTLDQCRAMISAIRARRDYRNPLSVERAALDECLFLVLLFNGARARTWSWGDALDHALNMPAAVYAALRALAMEKKLTREPVQPDRFMITLSTMGENINNPVFTAPSSLGRPFTTQEVTRRFKRYARLAGVSRDTMNLRTVANTYHELQRSFRTMKEVVELLGLSGPLYAPARSPGRNHADQLLHGIGRRSGRRAG